MAEFVVEDVGSLPAHYQPLTDRTLTAELRGLKVRNPRGHVGEIRVAYEQREQIRAFVRFPAATGWFHLSDLDPIFEESPCPPGPTTSSTTTPIATTAGLSPTASTTSSSSTTTATTSTEPSCACVGCVAILLSEITPDGARRE